MRERLQKILSARGVCSRRGAEELIKRGRVSVNGVTAELGASADPEADDIAIDGAPLAGAPEKLYIMLHKPRGYITTVSDDRGRRTVMSLVGDCGGRVYPVGRLDRASEGLLLLTNDGAFANAVAHPSGSFEKVYRVSVRGDMRDVEKRLSAPMELDGRPISPARIRDLASEAGGGVIEAAISEGRNRQIRRMCELCGLEVRRLIRTSEAGLALEGLPPGKWRRLTEAEVEKIMHSTR